MWLLSEQMFILYDNFLSIDLIESSTFRNWPYFIFGCRDCDGCLLLSSGQWNGKYSMCNARPIALCVSIMLSKKPFLICLTVSFTFNATLLQFILSSLAYASFHVFGSVFWRHLIEMTSSSFNYDEYKYYW